MLRAWVDESAHVGNGTYVLAAFVMRVDDSPEAADHLWRLRRGRAPRMHWRRETDTVRQRFVDGIRGIDGDAVIVVGTGLNRAKQERARRQCMQTLLTALHDREVGSVVLERRSPSLNDHDIDFIKALRGKRWLDPTLTVEFGDPNSDPILWVADAICGIVSANETQPGHSRLGFRSRTRLPASIFGCSSAKRRTTSVGSHPEDGPDHS